MVKTDRKRNHPRLLLVEGADEVRLIPELVEASGVRWDDDEHRVIVHLHDAGGNHELKNLIPVELTPAVRRAVGVIVDADQSASDRWKSIREHCLANIEGLEPGRWPVHPPAEGLVIDFEPPQGRRRLGVWIMPDNHSAGMLETFVQHLEPESSSMSGLFELAERACDDAARLGAPYIAAHRPKAIIHTWLAWQDPPGRQLHDAIKQRQLDPTKPLGRAFVRWFRRLYEI
ncbi:MAG: DUF3226 domain-containing protein [Nannocystaceae bacterium]